MPNASRPMPTHAEGAGAFARFDLARVPSPCFVVDEKTIEHNLRILADVAQSGARVVLALKAFAMGALAPLMGRYLHGVCASGLYEAQLGRSEYQGEVATFCAAYRQSDIDRVIALSDYVIFNSTAQKERFAAQCRKAGVRVGLRINPAHSEAENPRYDPCAPGSRLGVPIGQLNARALAGVSGLHMHSLCEQGFAPLWRTWQAVEPQLRHVLPAMQWLNLGGGHHITRGDYDRASLVAFLRDIRGRYGVQLYLEPGEAVALNAGILVGEVLDVLSNGRDLAIIDISATCHMPDVLESPYRPALMGEMGDATAGHCYRLGGLSCLAGDVIGAYTWPTPLRIGTRLAFLDQAHYSMVKTTTFNGVPLPAIALWNSETDALKLLRTAAYRDFRERLG